MYSFWSEMRYIIAKYGERHDSYFLNQEDAVWVTFVRLVFSKDGTFRNHFSSVIESSRRRGQCSAGCSILQTSQSSLNPQDLPFDSSGRINHVSEFLSCN